MGKKILYLLLSIIAVMLLVSCDLLDDDDDDTGTSNTGAGEIASEQPSEVRLSAFSDFSCTSNWTERDGALGLKAHTGSGTCQASFPGVSSMYKVRINVQAERDGASPYTLSINGKTVASGNYPYATGRLACDCSIEKCPDRNTFVNIGTLKVNKGDTIKYWGDQVSPCGDDHGAYAKWHKMIFTPVD